MSIPFGIIGSSEANATQTGDETMTKAELKEVLPLLHDAAVDASDEGGGGSREADLMWKLLEFVKQQSA